MSPPWCTVSMHDLQFERKPMLCILINLRKNNLLQKSKKKLWKTPNSYWFFKTNNFQWKCSTRWVFVSHFGIPWSEICAWMLSAAMAPIKLIIDLICELFGHLRLVLFGFFPFFFHLSWYCHFYWEMKNRP